MNNPQSALFGFGATDGWLTDLTSTVNKATNFVNTNVAPAISNVKNIVSTVRGGQAVAIPGTQVAYNPNLMQSGGAIAQPAPQGMSLLKKVAIGGGLILAGFAVYKLAKSK